MRRCACWRTSMQWHYAGTAAAWHLRGRAAHSLAPGGDLLPVQTHQLRRREAGARWAVGMLQRLLLGARLAEPLMQDTRRHWWSDAFQPGRLLRIPEGAAPDHGEFDVSSNVVSPVFRSTPWAGEQLKEGSSPDAVRVLFVSESNVCRSVLADAIMTQLLQAHDMAGAVSCASRGSKDFNLGEPPDPALQAVAEELELSLPEGQAAAQFDHERDIVAFDLVLVMDKFCAADVLREVSVYDTINKAGNYSAKVRMLGEYHSALADSKQPDGQDIDDPLYGNVGGGEEKEAVRRTAMIISDACNGLLDFLRDTRSAGQTGGTSFRAQLATAIGQMGTIDWLVPPMLSKT